MENEQNGLPHEVALAKNAMARDGPYSYSHFIVHQGKYVPVDKAGNEYEICQNGSKEVELIRLPPRGALFNDDPGHYWRAVTAAGSEKRQAELRQHNKEEAARQAALREEREQQRAKSGR